MHNPRSLLTTAIVVFALVVGVGAFGALTVIGDIHERNVAALLESARALPQEMPAETESLDQPEYYMISGRHVVRGEQHKIIGDVLLGSACESLSTEATVRETTPLSVEIAFTTNLDTVVQSLPCDPPQDTTPFVVTFEAPEDVIITATWNGGEAILSLIK